MKKTVLALMILAAGVAVYVIAIGGISSAQEPNCERPACRADDKYYRTRHRCESTSGLGHYPASCPPGYNLDEARGVCVQPGECCDKPACKRGYRFRNGRCESGPSGIGGYRSHYYPNCGAGWDLIAATGMCRKRDCGGVSGAQIDRLGPTPCVDRGGTVTIDGSGFGREQGTRVVELGGHGIGVLLRVTSWSDTQITAIVPDDRRIQFGQWYYIGLQNQDRQWLSNISRTINICRRIT